MKQKLFGLFLVMAAALSFFSAQQVSAADTYGDDSGVYTGSTTSACTTAGASCQLNSTTTGVCGNVCVEGECGLSCVAGSVASPIPGGNAASGAAASSAASAPAAASNKKSAVTDGAVQGLYIPRGSSIGLSDMPITRLIENLMKWLLYIVGFVAIIAFVIAGLQYLLAGADSKMAEKAKESMTYAMIGVLVALSALIVIRAIQAVLSGSLIF